MLPTVFQLRHDVFNYPFHGKGNRDDAGYIFLEGRLFKMCNAQRMGPSSRQVRGWGEGVFSNKSKALNLAKQKNTDLLMGKFNNRHATTLRSLALTV